MSNDSSLSGVEISSALPNSRHGPYGGEAEISRIIDGRIVAFGGADHDAGIEGGGLVIDYIPKDKSEITRVVFAFNECGMWVVYEGEKTDPEDRRKIREQIGIAK